MMILYNTSEQTSKHLDPQLKQEGSHEYAPKLVKKVLQKPSVKATSKGGHLPLELSICTNISHSLLEEKERVLQEEIVSKQQKKEWKES